MTLETVEVTGFSISGGVVEIYTVDCSEEHYQHILRMRRDDDYERELTFVFDTTESRPLTDLYRWLNQQQAVNKEAEHHRLSWKEALECTIGSITCLPTRYLDLNY